MLTTESEKQLVVRLLQLGVQQFIIKPFEKQEFITKVGGVLAKMAKKGQAGDKGAATPGRKVRPLSLRTRRTSRARSNRRPRIPTKSSSPPTPARR